MKRWITILERAGTTLIAISLALLLVSLIPQVQSSHTVGSTSVGAGQFSVAFSPGSITPQQEVHVAVTVEGTLKVYLLEIDVRPQFVNGTFNYGFNLTDLQELLDNYPEQKLWEHEVVNSNYERNYTPPRIMNATVIVYNPSSETAQLEYDMSLRNSLAPGEKVRTIAYFAAPLGVIMTVPWLLDFWKQRKHK